VELQVCEEIPGFIPVVSYLIRAETRLLNLDVIPKTSIAHGICNWSDTFVASSPPCTLEGYNLLPPLEGLKDSSEG
jgi:hypothetical protein